MKLSDIINPEAASLEQAQAVHDAIHTIYVTVLGDCLRLILHPNDSVNDTFESLVTLLYNLDTESRYLVEDILEEMMDQEDEGGVI